MKVYPHLGRNPAHSDEGLMGTRETLALAPSPAPTPPVLEAETP